MTVKTSKEEKQKNYLKKANDMDKKIKSSRKKTR